MNYSMLKSVIIGLWSDGSEKLENGVLTMVVHLSISVTTIHW